MRAFSLPSTLRIRIAFHFCCCLQVLFSLQMQWIWNCKPIKDKLYFITRTHKTKSIESFVVNVLVRFARRLHLIFSFRRNSSWDLLIQCIHWHPSYTWISFLFSEFSHLFDSNPIFPLQYQSILRNCIFFQSSWLFLGIFYQTPPPPPPLSPLVSNYHHKLCWNELNRTCSVQVQAKCKALKALLISFTLCLPCVFLFNVHVLEFCHRLFYTTLKYSSSRKYFCRFWLCHSSMLRFNIFSLYLKHLIFHVWDDIWEGVRCSLAFIS